MAKKPSPEDLKADNERLDAIVRQLTDRPLFWPR
jgi:hypothetical protein